MPQPDWEDLERRVARIERVLRLAPETPAASAVAEAPVVKARPEISSALLPIVGQCLLGLAGAYLLRAATESGRLSSEAGVGLGLVYAILWLVWAARTPAERRIETALRSLTSALVLAPLLWEATLRFHALNDWAVGAMLVLFTGFGLAVSWRKNLLTVATIATLVGVGTAAGLLVATRDVVPYTVVLLTIAAAVEVSACLEHWLSERWLAALAADGAVLLATWLVTGERGLPEGYAPIPYGWLLGAQIALLTIYLSSTIVRTLARGFTFTGFETAQCAAAFLLGVGGGLRLSKEAPLVALFALACAAACYVVSFKRLDQDESKGRNFYTYSTFGMLLVLAGSRILMTGITAAAVWSALAVGCIWTGRHFGRLTLELHGGVYLLMALVGLGALGEAARFLLGSGQWPGEGPLELIAGVVVAVVCYALSARSAREGSTWNRQLYRLILAATAVWLTTGLAAGLFTGIYHGAFGESASHAYCATLRTSVLAGAALWMAWFGSSLNRAEFTRLIYPSMALGGYRLLIVDLHGERTVALFLSLLVYGATLIILPRIARLRTADNG